MNRYDILRIISLLLIVIGIMLGTVYYFYNQEQECIRDPVAYANNNSKNYDWSSVVPIEYDVVPK